MKPRLVWLPWVLLSAVLAMGLARTRVGEPISAYWLATPEVAWQSMGEITDANTAFGDDEFQWDEVYEASDPNWIVFKVPNDASGAEFRFLTDADGDSHVVNIYVCASERVYRSANYDSFTLGATLTLTGGTMDGPSSNNYVDTIAETVAATLDGDILDSATNRYAVWKVDLRGWKYVAVMATTLQASSTLDCHIRWY